MRLGRPGYDRPRIPTVPLASLAVAVLSLVAIAGMYSASRGPALRFASVDRDGRFRDADAVRVEVFSDQEAQVDGEPVSLTGLADAVASRLSRRSDATVVLVVSPEATYETMVMAYGALAGLPGPPRIALASRARETRL
jgi:biopolymer transport protein ExbD